MITSIRRLNFDVPVGSQVARSGGEAVQRRGIQVPVSITPLSGRVLAVPDSECPEYVTTDCFEWAMSNRDRSLGDSIEFNGEAWDFGLKQRASHIVLFSRTNKRNVALKVPIAWVNRHSPSSNGAETAGSLTVDEARQMARNNDQAWFERNLGHWSDLVTSFFPDGSDQKWWSYPMQYLQVDSEFVDFIRRPLGREGMAIVRGELVFARFAEEKTFCVISSAGLLDQKVDLEQRGRKDAKSIEGMLREYRQQSDAVMVQSLTERAAQYSSRIDGGHSDSGFSMT